MVAVPILVLATSGCATKRYVRQNMNTVNAKVDKLEKHTNDKIAYLDNKLNTEMSQANEHIATAYQKATQAMDAAQQAQGTASRAMEESEANAAKISANVEATNTLASGVANALNYQLVDQGDVLFAFGKSNLTPAGKTALDAIVQKYQSLPRGVIEIAGFTDPVGSASFNLALSRRRAQTVERYLVNQKVPLRAINIVGLGKEMPPAPFAPDQARKDAATTRAERHQLARRVHLNVYGAGDITQGTASRSEEK
jgi:outer membrane protein OmpA-like peptidoglycan-associated protein